MLQDHPTCSYLHLEGIKLHLVIMGAYSTPSTLASFREVEERLVNPGLFVLVYCW